MSLFIDIHAIQSVPPANLNRDLNGSPKKAIFGGVPRARVSSQAWKRPIRLAFAEHYQPEDLAVRTKRLALELADQVREIDPTMDEEEAAKVAIATFGQAGIKLSAPKKKKDAPLTEYESGYLMFLSRHQLRNAAELAVQTVSTEGVEGLKGKKKELKQILNSDLSVDLALFGRMVAEVSDLSVDASCQVAHAISTHEVGTEFDFFTAVDDTKDAAEDEDAGAGMMGTVEFNSATLYRYATINVTELAQQLGSIDAATYAVASFIDGFVKTMPTGKQNTFAAHSLPEALLVSLSTSRPLSFANAFEEPVTAFDSRTGEATGYARSSVKKLVTHRQDFINAYGPLAIKEWATGVGEATEALTEGGLDVTTYPDLVAQLKDAITAELNPSGALEQQ